MVDSQELERAASITSSATSTTTCAPAPYSAQEGEDPASESNTQAECQRLTQTCMEVLGCSDSVGFKVMLANIELAMWVLK